MQTLIKKRGSLKSRVTTFTKFIDSVRCRKVNTVNPLNGAEVISLAERISKFEPVINEFEVIQEQIDLLVEDTEVEINEKEREDFSNFYYNSISVAKELLSGYKINRTENSVPPVSSASSSASIGQTQQFTGVKLPTIELPKFDGLHQDWLQYRETFQSLIHDNETVNNVQKFHYLKASLEKSAAQVIENLEFSASNYSVAWDVLCSRFNNPRLLVHNHIKLLFNLENIPKESSLKIRKLIDDLTKHLRSLKLLGQPTEHWDTLVIYIVSTKLDQVTLREWEKQKAENDLPTLEKMKQFLKGRADLLETLEVNAGADKRLHKLGSSHNSNVKTYVASTISCAICKGEHLIQNCEEFLKLSINDKTERIKGLRLCINCLKRGHFSWRCRATTCGKCKAKHNTLLHSELKTENPSPSGSNDSSLVVASCGLSNRQVLLSTALIYVANSNNKFYSARALLDSGSQSSFITRDFGERLNLPLELSNISVSGISNSISYVRNKCRVKFQAQHNAYKDEVVCYVLPEITGDVPNCTVDINRLNIPKNIKLADPSFSVPGKIDILIGADRFWDLISVGHIPLGLNQPVLHKTRLGWIVSGATAVQQRQRINCNLAKTMDVQRQLAQFWEIEENYSEKVLSREEKACEIHFKRSTTRTANGRFVVSIPFKQTFKNLGESRERARKRFWSLERKLQSDAELRQSYIDFMEEYKAISHMSKAQVEDAAITAYYMPHHGVVRETSSTTRLRVVFDASASTSSGLSLNDIQMTGPVIQDDLLSIILRFRTHRFVVSADIAKMYRQVLIQPEQRPLQRILWRSDPSQPLETYELNTMTYVRCLHELADACQDTAPDVTKVIKRDFYVDDLLTGANSIWELSQICKWVNEVLLGGCFELRKWISNDPKVLEGMGESQTPTTVIQFGENDRAKTLGLNWACRTDDLMYTINVNTDRSVTKRSILSITAHIFDPLGLVSPCIIVAKIMLQKLWKENVTWDESVPANLHFEWLKFKDELIHLNDLCIPRHVMLHKSALVELHGFCDASESAYGACIYIRSVDDTGSSDVRLLCAKSKVAPLKTISVPRLELCGALVLAKLTAKVQQSLETKFNHLIFWTDSTIVLGWLGESPSSLKIFVGNRVSKIQSLTDTRNWRHVSTKDNPADLVSRGTSPKQLTDCKLWWKGPTWLAQSKDNWPKNCFNEKSLKGDLPELRQVSAFLTRSVNLNFERFSNLNKLERVVAYCLRFKMNALRPREQRHFGPITVEEGRCALNALVKIAQRESFPQDIDRLNRNEPLHTKSNILSLNPFIDAGGILRVGGRLQESLFKYEKRHPILLSSKHYLTRRIFNQEHLRLLHAGPQLLLSSIREVFWPINGRNLAKKTVRDCVRCFRVKPKSVYPIMGNLPEARVTPGFPFKVVGVDYAGPLQVKDRKGRGCKITKCYVCLFICFASKAIHLELVTDLTTNSFMLSLKRFVARRGKPTHIYSDNGTNFVGAKSELERLGKFLKGNRDELLQSFASENINWQFTPPHAPHFGGLWEAGVKSVKHHLRRVAGNALLTFEEMYTVLVQIEAVLNSRPLSPLSSDPEDLSPLTPAHFLIGRPLTSLPDIDITDTPVNRLTSFQKAEQITQHFWKRWAKEYISELQQRVRWKQTMGSIGEGDIVLVKDDNTPPMKWGLGIVVKLHPGNDGVVRVVTIKTRGKLVKRAVTKVCALPLNENSNE